MSTEAALPSSSTELTRAKRQGLRVALAVTFGFSMGLVNGSVLPFLAPLFATQFLLGSRSPPPLRQGLGVVAQTEQGEAALGRPELFEQLGIVTTAVPNHDGPIAGLALLDGDHLTLRGEILRPDGSEVIRGARRMAVTDAAEAVQMAATGIDALAISVGNVHLMQSTDAVIDRAAIDRIAALCPGLPLVLHGGSGIAGDDRRDLRLPAEGGTDARQGFGQGLR